MPTTCIPFANGVPAAGGPPVWWDTTSGSEPAFNPRIDDPRWRGATAKSYPTGGGGAGEHAVFRGLHHTDGGATSLYLSWFVKVDPVLNDGPDRLFVGFQRPGGDAVVIRFTPFTTVPTSNQFAVPLSTRTWVRSGTTWTALADEPDWLATFTRSWIFTSPPRWAVNLRVPLITGANLDDTGMNLGTAFRMWYELQVVQPTGTIVRHTWTRGAPSFSGTSYPDPASASWDEFVLGSSPTACSTGVSLAVLDVGTTNTPASLIRYSRTSPVTNTLVARPLNQTGSTIPASTTSTTNLSARFRLANWGSMADWNDVPNPDTLWTDIPGGGNVANAASIMNGTQGTLTFNWQLSSTEIDQFDPPGGGTPPRRSHQCMLVELSGQGLDFINDSVYRNMDVVSASTFKRDAEVSVVGLGSLGPPKRNVYLYVESSNMPKTTSGKKPRPREDERGRSIDDVGGQRGEPVAIDDVAADEPTYRVHVLHETGGSVTQDGVTRPELRPQSSFGYFVQHQGDLYGWDHKLKGPWLIELAPNFYRVKVPNEGKVTVTTEIKAWEKPRPWWWWLWELLLRLAARIKSWIGRLLGK